MSKKKQQKLKSLKVEAYDLVSEITMKQGRLKEVEMEIYQIENKEK